MNPLSAERRLDNHDLIRGVMLDEDFVPIHKSAGHVPYDILFTVEGAHENWGEDAVSNLVEDALRDYDSVVSIEENTTDLNGDTVVFLSLFSFK